MSKATNLFAVVGVLLMLGSLAGPAAAQDDTNDSVLNVSIDQDEETAAVTVVVTDDGDPVVDAAVNVTSENEYAGDGDYTTDENGTVGLPAPEETVTITVTASADGVDGEEERTIEPLAFSVAVEQDTNGNVTILVTDNETAVQNATVTVSTVANDTTYVGDGTYTTGDNGTVALSAPEETVEVVVTASDENRTVTTSEMLLTTEELYAELAADAFGQAVSAYVHMLKGDDTASIGPEVAEFVLEHNPGNAPDHAGPPAWVTDDERTPPGQDDDRERGPPAHANGGGPSDDGEDEEGELEDGADETEDDDTEDGDD